MTEAKEFNSSEIAAELPEKPEKSFSVTERIFAFISLILGFAFVRYTVFSVTGFVTTALYIVIITAAIFFLRKSGKRLNGLNRLLAAVLYLFSTVFSITDNRLIKILDVAFMFVIGTYFVYSASGEKKRISRFLPFEMADAAVFCPFSDFGSELHAVKSAGSDNRLAGTVKMILVGLAAAVPLTAVVGALLISADDGIEKFFNNILNAISGIDLWGIFWQALIAIPCACYLFGMLYSNAHRDGADSFDELVYEEKLNNARRIRNVILYTMVTPICLLYILFFISQANYFLSAFSGRLPQGLLYSEYARTGFFELVAIAAINLAVIIIMNVTAEKGGASKPAGLRFYSIVLCVFTIIMTAVAFSKMTMYVSVYGLTRLRFYTTWFMFLMLAFFVMIIIKQFRFDFRIAKWGTAVFTFMFALLCFCRPDALIAKYNIFMYSSGHLEELDIDALTEMSDDAVYELLKTDYADREEILTSRYARHKPRENQNLSSVLVGYELERTQ